MVKKYYRYLADLVVEIVKGITIAKSQVQERCIIENVNLLHKLYKKKKNIVLVMGHIGNWEWAGNSLALATKYQLFAIYKPLRQKYINNISCQLRSRFKRKIIPYQNILKTMLQYNTSPKATAFLFDQYPGNNHIHTLSTKFLHTNTHFFLGPAKIAQKFNYPIVYIGMKKIQRGYYTIHIELITEKPQQKSKEAIAKAYIQKLENDIKKNPICWLWSHKRWKNQLNY